MAPRKLDAEDIISEAKFTEQLRDEKITNNAPPAVVMVWEPKQRDPQDVEKITVRMFPHTDEDHKPYYWKIVLSQSKHEVKVPHNRIPSFNSGPTEASGFPECLNWAAKQVATYINYEWTKEWNKNENDRVCTEMVLDAIEYAQIVS